MSHRRGPKQLELPRPPSWGGAREGAGRKPLPKRRGPPHATRPAHQPRHPIHVTMRAQPGLLSLRSEKIFSSLRRALAACSRDAFRVIQFSVQTNHVHLIVEADDAAAFTRGVQGLAVRCARAINQPLGRRGTVWKERYHAHALGTPREVRRGLAYVLLNFRKHLRAPPAVDPRSSGPWFQGWLKAPRRPGGPCPVAPSRTWLASIGWRRAGGPIGLDEGPEWPGER